MSGTWRDRVETSDPIEPTALDPWADEWQQAGVTAKPWEVHVQHAGYVAGPTRSWQWPTCPGYSVYRTHPLPQPRRRSHLDRFFTEGNHRLSVAWSVLRHGTEEE